MTLSKDARRFIAVGVSIGALLLAGCAGQSPGGGSSGEVEGSTITIGTFSPLVGQFETYAEAYMKEFPDRTVKVTGVSEDFAKYQQILATQRISNKLPDIFFNVDFAANEFAKSDVPLDIAPRLNDKKGLEESFFLPQFLGQYRPLDAPDEITGLPVSADSTALVYNKTLFAEAGVDEFPTSDWTWDDFLRVATEIQTNSDGAIFGTVPPAGDGSQIVTWGPVLAANGAAVYDPETNDTDIDSPEALEAWESMVAFYGTGSGEYTATAGDPSYDFSSGRVAMGITSRANIAGFREALGDADWDVAEVPSINGTHPSGGGSYAMSIASTSKNADAAWAFMEWFYKLDGGLALAQQPDAGGIIPPTVDGLESGTWQDVDVPANMSVFAKTATDATLMVSMPGSANNVMTDATKQAFQEVLLNGSSVEDAFGTAAEKVRAALADAE
jgi:multiple sugar transport system substrate-binding protein